MSSQDSLDWRSEFAKENEEDSETRNEAASEFSKSWIGNLWSMTPFFVAFSLFIISEGCENGDIVMYIMSHNTCIRLEKGKERKIKWWFRIFQFIFLIKLTFVDKIK